MIVRSQEDESGSAGRYNTPILPPMNRLRRHTVAPVDNIAVGLSRVPTF